MKRPVFIIVLGALAFSLVSAQAAAWMPEKQLRVHLESHLLEVATGEVNPDGPGEADFGEVEIGIGMDKGAVGFGVTLGPGFVLGGRLILDQETDTWGFGDNEWFVWSILPYLEYVWLTGIVRPFVKGQLGIEGLHDENYDFFGILLGAGGGIHIFPNTDRLSLDVNGDFTFRFGGGDANDDAAGGHFNHWRFAFAIAFGISGWF